MSSKICHNFGTLIFVKNTYKNIGKAPLYRFSKNIVILLLIILNHFIKLNLAMMRKIENNF